ncbi:monooxygenase [Sphingopyxis lindanitolerans]|uniref:Monooxygenase n=1 Tax=Sphingopyxis lindanitolerans TaxID=2054227 RepID=A0A2S8B1L0_9SPHN|nr:NAD(P)/FAD-dependent oxidoreductase [Sphingopyxis lindanitolerans]PQM26291.1 monooxygenase [Sphingopyxis lindanitolerans]
MTDDKGSLDGAALKARYLAERAKRLRAEGMDQYIATSGALARYREDPHTPQTTRAAVSEDIEVAVIGGGWGGLQAAVELVKAGIDDFRIIDKAGDVGGVWYWNRYPGASCDIESYIYMPMLEDMDYIPTEKYTRGPEMFFYARSVAEKFDLYRRALLQTEVSELRWDEASGRWLISTRQGDRLRARFVLVSTGQLQSVRLPGIPGVESYKGRSFHTSRWDYDYTGGNATGGLDKLSDKRVGIIGTGATAVQTIPHLGASAGHLYVFQRTPAAVPARNNGPTDPVWAESLRPGWQMERMVNFNRLISGIPQKVDLVNDGWTEVLTGVGIEIAGYNDGDDSRQRADFAYMEGIRARVDDIVMDGTTAEALKPWFNAMCKRPCFHDAYLDTFNRPNVSLVDTDGRGVERISETAVWVNGEAYEVDCLIYASGFEFQTPDLVSRNGFEIFGRGGQSLTEKWAPGMRTLFGHLNRGFPNLFNQTASQSGLTANVTHGLGESARHFAFMVGYCRDNRIRSFEPSAAAEDAWSERVHALSGLRARFDAECTPGYFNNDGQPQAGGGLASFYPGGAEEFIALIKDWCAAGTFEGLDIQHA